MITSSPCFQLTGVATAVLRRQLQRVDDAQHLIEIAPGGHRIDEEQLDLLVGSDDEDGAHGLIVGGRALGRIARGARPAACRRASPP